MRASISYPVEIKLLSGGSLGNKMVIDLEPEPDFKGGDDGAPLKQAIKTVRQGDVITITISKPNGERKITLSAHVTNFSSTWETLAEK